MKKAKPAAEIDLAVLRRVMGSFATGVTVILAEAAGETRGMTANAFLSGSLEPPLCVVSIAKRAHMHAHLAGAGRFSVNILAIAQEDLALHFAGRPTAGPPPSFQHHDGVPLLPDAASQLTARVVETHDCGDHTLFVGAIRWIAANNRTPLVYHAGRFASLLPREETGALLEFW
jgi:flavin reductase (DIM6/NTAB) family NADH-FMN oxidoreductase RutF